MALNTATSIVDFLKSQGKSSDFNSRKGVYDTSGLSSAFGEYRGTPEQNTTLLRKLSTTAKPSVPEGVTYNPATNISTTGPTPKDVIDETTPSTISTAFDLEKSDADKALEAEKKGLTFDLAAQTTRGAETLQRGVSTLKRMAGEGVSSLEAKGTQLKERVGEKAAGFGGAFAGVTKKSQAEIAQEVTQKQGQIQAKLGDQLYNTFTDFEKNYGTKFLESLSIPEAQQFTKLPAPVRGIVMQNYQDAVVKAEEKAQKSALSTLEKLGYVVVGGQVIQKPSEARAEAGEERARRGLELREEAGQRAEARLDESDREKRIEEGPEAIDVFARDLSRGLTNLSSVPSKIRTQVRLKAKQFTVSDMVDDIGQAKTRKDFGNREQLIERLEKSYPELTKDEVATQVYASIPDQPRELNKGFFQRVFGRF